ncbi:hypothetical protein ES705_49528 [subsurface metagenome]
MSEEAIGKYVTEDDVNGRVKSTWPVLPESHQSSGMADFMVQFSLWKLFQAQSFSCMLELI